MKYYIVYYINTNQYNITNKKYYVSYKDKTEDNYSDNYIFAKRYTKLIYVFNKIGLEYKGYHATRYIHLLEQGKDIIPDNIGVEVVKLTNNRSQKLSKISGKDYSPIKNLGKISSNELIDFLKKESDKFLSSNEGKYYDKMDIIKTATQEEIDDFCS